MIHYLVEIPKITLRSVFKFIVFLNIIVWGALFLYGVFLPHVLDRLEGERVARAEYMCRIYDVCDPKAGP